MNKYVNTAIIVAILLIGVSYAIMSNEKASEQIIATGPTDYKNGSYTIDGTRVELKNGVSIVEAAPGSATKIETRYFGNDLVTDLNGDGLEDHVFLVTQNTGGTGTFYYVVAALNTPDGYVGSDGYRIRDRIAPQNINLRTNPRHKNVIVANFAERAPGEPMTARPSVGKSVYLKIDPASNMWGIVEADFEGESR